MHELSGTDLFDSASELLKLHVDKYTQNLSHPGRGADAHRLCRQDTLVRLADNLRRLLDRTGRQHRSYMSEWRRRLQGAEINQGQTTVS